MKGTLSTAEQLFRLLLLFVLRDIGERSVLSLPLITFQLAFLSFFQLDSSDVVVESRRHCAGEKGSHVSPALIVWLFSVRKSNCHFVEALSSLRHLYLDLATTMISIESS